jgi:hypothetical protein
MDGVLYSRVFPHANTFVADVLILTRRQMDCIANGHKSNALPFLLPASGDHVRVNRRDGHKSAT